MNKYDDEMIRGLFDNFIAEGNKASVTGFKKHLNELIDSHIKHLTTRSGKTGGGEAAWRRELKAKFSGKGAKWVYVSLSEVKQTIEQFEADGIDCDDYKAFIELKGSAWIRFSGARIFNNSNCAAFEVRTSGSKLDHPKQLHYIAIDVLDSTIQPMGKTPHSLGLETISSSKDKTEEAQPSVTSTVTQADVVIGPIVNETELLQEITGMQFEADHEEELQAPTSDNPEEWEAFLSAEGLSDPELEDNFDDDLNDDIF